MTSRLPKVPEGMKWCGGGHAVPISDFPPATQKRRSGYCRKCSAKSNAKRQAKRIARGDDFWGTVDNGRKPTIGADYCIYLRERLAREGIV